MTRYEMAQIVAKAMAKGANVDKLAAEFADELDALGVRVAALEKKSDNVKITGQFRWSYASYKDQHRGQDETKSHTNLLRSRITFTGRVNDNWEYVGMLENQHQYGDTSAANVNSRHETTHFQRAYLQGRLGGLKTVAGRLNKSVLASDMYGTRMDGIDLTYGAKVKLNAYYGKPTNAKSFLNGAKPTQVWGVNAAADLGKNVNLFVGYDKFDMHHVDNNDGDDGVFSAGLIFKLGKDAKLGGTYLHTSYNTDDGRAADGKNNGFIIGAEYKGAKNDKPGSWGIAAKYYQVPAGFFTGVGWEDGHSADTADMRAQGSKGWWVRANYAVAKNIIADIEYWDLKSRVTDCKSKTLWTALNFAF
jgi:phosphate-selective porin